MGEEEKEYEDQWWYHRSKLFLRFFAPLLYVSSSPYRMWRFFQKPPEKRRKEVESKARKMRKQMDFPKITKQDIVGRDEDFARVLISAHYHIFRNPEIRKSTSIPPPKIFILKGGSGSGKTFFAEACQREVFEAGLQFATLVYYASLKPEQVYTMWYGNSAQRLSSFFQQSFERPSILLIDEFHAFGARFASSTEIGMEEKRVQTVFLEKLDELEKRDYRTILFLSTNEYETITDTLRRRAVVGTIDLDLGTNRLMLIEIARRQCHKYGIELDPGEIVDNLEDVLRSVGATRLSPADVVNAFNIVMTEKSKPIQNRLIEGAIKKEVVSTQDLAKQVTINNFRTAARNLKTYISQEKTDAAKRAINRITPKERYKDVGGLHGIKEEIIKEISLSLDSDLAIKSGYLPP